MMDAVTQIRPTMASSPGRATLLDGQRQVLERVATDAPLEEVLHALVGLIEEQAGNLRCAVLLADAAQKRLRFVAAPNVPEDYKVGMQPHLLISPNMTACGSAAYFRQPVYTRDTAMDMLWENCGEIAARNGLRAVWSMPILSAENRVLGTLTMYYGEPRLPSDEHIRLVHMAVQLARVAIAAKADGELLRVTFDHSPHAIVITDLDGIIVRANHAFAEQLDYNPVDLRGKPKVDIVEARDDAILTKDLLENEDEVSSTRRYRAQDGAMLSVRERSSVRRDENGAPRFVITYAEMLVEGADQPLARLSRRERQVLELVVAGRTSKEMASKLAVSPATVDTYRSRIMLKLGIDDLPSLVRFAIRHGISKV